MRGVNRCYLQSYLDEYCWRDNKNLDHFLTETLKSVNMEELKDDLEYEDDDLLSDVEKALPDGNINDFNIPIITNVNIDGQCINLDSNGIFLDDQSIKTKKRKKLTLFIF
ncbi:unnamed protein product [Brachionus calyciflorus]|uniref:Uncharacterized protein n=1 Tax=Brachionus calyciflorus TaxID=104777 RepID=A0A814MH17_9BILA|nr:unnamed protein product [Brachionus calyciflorus]